MEEAGINKSTEKKTKGWINGFIGVVLFSGSMPATKLAVLDFGPVFLTVARGTVTGLLALCVLLIYIKKRPTKQQILPLAIVSSGVVIGFPLLTAFALQYITSAHALVFLGMLPLATAVFGVLRGRERPRPAFWFFSISGSLLVIGYTIAQGLSVSPVGDILMLLAVALCGLGYAEGAKLSKTQGGLQVISWALILALPIMAILMFFLLPPSFTGISTTAWVSLGYISIFGFIGFVFWYRGLAQGGTAAVGQIQLLLPFLGLALAATLLHERISIAMLGVTIGVILCVVGSRKFAN